MKVFFMITYRAGPGASACSLYTDQDDVLRAYDNVRAVWGVSEVKIRYAVAHGSKTWFEVDADDLRAHPIADIYEVDSQNRSSGFLVATVLILTICACILVGGFFS